MTLADGRDILFHLEFQGRRSHVPGVQAAERVHALALYGQAQVTGSKSASSAARTRDDRAVAW